MSTTPPRTIRRFGWIRSLPDPRDVFYTASPATLKGLPEAVDLRPQCPPVYEQGELGSCTANATAAAVQFDEMKQHLTTPQTPSRLFIYYNERLLNGTPNSDSGAQLRDGVKVVSTQGICMETLWPYDIEQFAVQPPPEAYAAAALMKARNYFALPQKLRSLQACLAEGYPFTLGFTVFESFKADTMATGSIAGVMPMPKPDEEVLGGHAVLAVGYSNLWQAFVVRNSWGPAWGMAGYFLMPYAFMLDSDLCADFWTIRAV